jgi:glycine cleavage system H protein
MNIPTDLKYTTNDEWIRVAGGAGEVGVTDHAQEALSDIVFVEITVAVGDEVKQGDTCAAVESVKAAADVYLPAGGKVIAVNTALPDAPETINSDPYGAAWIVKLELTAPAELDGLLDPAAYEKHLAEKE